MTAHAQRRVAWFWLQVCGGMVFVMYAEREQLRLCIPSVLHRERSGAQGNEGGHRKPYRAHRPGQELAPALGGLDTMGAIPIYAAWS